jgi:hypothetical protein
MVALGFGLQRASFLAVGDVKKGTGMSVGSQLAHLSQLELTLADGIMANIANHASWRVSTGQLSWRNFTQKHDVTQEVPSRSTVVTLTFYKQTNQGPALRHDSGAVFSLNTAHSSFL